jgi:quinol monooxygenase YgiN
MIKVVSKNQVPTENIEAFKALAAKMVDETIKEDGCIDYALFEDEEDPNILVFVETWESRAHLEAHFEAPHFKLYVPQLGALRTDKELTILKSIV